MEAIKGMTVINDIRLSAVRYSLPSTALGDFKAVLESKATLLRKYVE